MNVPSSNNPPPDPKAAFAALETTTKVMTDKDWIRELLPVIKEKRAAGWSYEDIRAALAETVGFKGTLKTLYTYIYRLSLSNLPPSAEGSLVTSSSSDRHAPHPSESNTTPPSGSLGIDSVDEGTPRTTKGRFKDSLDPKWVEAMQMRPKTKKESMVDKLNRPL